MFCETWLSLAAGMIFPGKAWPVVGSRGTIAVPLKSPFRMASVGTVAREPPKICFAFEPS